MTNAEILKIFTKKYPNAEVSDYRPIAGIHIPEEHAGIIIWLKNGDILIYFPRETEKENNK